MRLLRAITAAACSVLMAMGSAAAAAELQVGATYLINLGGTNIASVGIRLNDTGTHYAMAVDARVSGLAQLIASGTARIASVGRSTGSGLVSEKFDLQT